MFLVFIHELWHFWAAKKAGVKVKEFGIGIPPKAISLHTDASGTEYTLNWIPLGWFVRLKWENPEWDDFLDADSFVSASLPWKLFILAAWVLMNLWFAWVLFTALFMSGVKPVTVISENMMKEDVQSYLIATRSFLDKKWYLSGDIQEVPIQVAEVFSWSLASGAGILSGDTIVSIDATPVTNLSFWSVLKQQIDATFALEFTRDGKNITKQVTCPDDQCFFGIRFAGWGTQEILPITMWFTQAMKASAYEIKEQAKITFGLMWYLWRNLFSGESEKVERSVNKLSWPVGIVKFGEQILEFGGRLQYLAFGGMVSLALAFFNMLPIPALDGGRALGVLIQNIFRLKPESYYKVEWYFNFIVFILMMLLGIYIIMLDLVRFRWVNIPFIWS